MYEMYIIQCKHKNTFRKYVRLYSSSHFWIQSQKSEFSEVQIYFILNDTFLQMTRTGDLSVVLTRNRKFQICSADGKESFLINLENVHVRAVCIQRLWPWNLWRNSNIFFNRNGPIMRYMQVGDNDIRWMLSLRYWNG